MSFKPVGLPSKPKEAAEASPTVAGPSTPATPTSAGPVAGPSSHATYGPVAPAGAAAASAGTANYDYSQYYGGAAASGYDSYGGYGAGTSGYGYDAYGQAAAGSSYGAGYNYDAGSYGAAGVYGVTDEELAAQQSIYTTDNTAQAQMVRKVNKGQARTTVLRKGAGETWEDPTLMEWDPSWFRLFVGDLGNDVNDDDLVREFGKDKGWTSFQKAKVVRDKVTLKTRGYGFVAYSDPEDFMKAWKAMDGKYVGSRPIKLSKATTQVRKVNIGTKKAKELDNKKKTNIVGNKVRGAVNPTGAWKPYIRR